MNTLALNDDLAVAGEPGGILLGEDSHLAGGRLKDGVLLGVNERAPFAGGPQVSGTLDRHLVFGRTQRWRAFHVPEAIVADSTETATEVTLCPCPPSL